jgi:hypothetical protein
MGWIYVNNNKINMYNEAFNKFLNQCLINENMLAGHGNYNKLKIIIKTNDDNDKIVCNGNIYLKSRFLTNKIFKQKLINYYRSFGLYVNMYGPNNFKNKDGTESQFWFIELK